MAGSLFFNLFKLDAGDNTFFIAADSEDKSMLKKTTWKIRSWVYREATIHNPEGDVLPDGLDEEVAKEIKNKIK